MMVSYYIEALFTTTYFVVLMSNRLRLGRPVTKRQRMLSYLANAFKNSVKTFLVATVIFALSMLGAAIARYARYLNHPEEQASVYSLVSSVYMSVFTIFPCLILQSVSEPPRRR